MTEYHRLGDLIGTYVSCFWRLSRTLLAPGWHGWTAVWASCPNQLVHTEETLADHRHTPRWPWNLRPGKGAPRWCHWTMASWLWFLYRLRGCVLFISHTPFLWPRPTTSEMSADHMEAQPEKKSWATKKLCRGLWEERGWQGGRDLINH